MDEKWFYAVVTQSKYKVVTYIGLEGEYIFFQQKNNLGKEMYIVITGYEVRDNDITNYGRDFPVTTIRVGKISKEDKDTLKGVYRDDGT